MPNYPALKALVSGIVGLDNRTKQELGRRFAFRLGFEPGPRGPDDGVDGRFELDGRIYHFQSKLSASDLDRDEARKYYSDIVYHAADMSVMLAGTGYKETFNERLFGHHGIENVRVFLLTLRDVFAESPAFQAAAAQMPGLRDLVCIPWDEFA